MGAQMRTFIVAFASFGLFATAAQAADTSSIAEQLPDDVESNQLYLFQLKKNGISLKMSGKNFCSKLKYGDEVLEHQANSEVSRDDQKEIPGDLEWVICRFNRKR
jgi:hypothetical protein